MIEAYSQCIERNIQISLSCRLVLNLVGLCTTLKVFPRNDLAVAGLSLVPSALEHETIYLQSSSEILINRVDYLTLTGVTRKVV